MDIKKRFEFREINLDEGEQAAKIETICFPPHEACSRDMMLRRVAQAPESFVVAVDKETGLIAGYVNGLATMEKRLRDEFFSDEKLYDPNGINVMILGVEVLPDYQGQGLATELVERFYQHEKEHQRKQLILTCLPDKIKMYEKMGFEDQGWSDSAWGGERWHEMIRKIR